MPLCVDVVVWPLMVTVEVEVLELVPLPVCWLLFEIETDVRLLPVLAGAVGDGDGVIDADGESVTVGSGAMVAADCTWLDWRFGAGADWLRAQPPAPTATTRTAAARWLRCKIGFVRDISTPYVRPQ